MKYSEGPRRGVPKRLFSNIMMFSAETPLKAPAHNPWIAVGTVQSTIHTSLCAFLEALAVKAMRRRPTPNLLAPRVTISGCPYLSLKFH